ncbi:energy transducer TonB [Marinifilum fragile]|uniref:energy transducer TonB n=1 Tax=Marinifilum fragile TaxID=570161 RepID=UPI002AA9621D|nr:energy transducer TonB [Marinifilum fragile]
MKKSFILLLLLVTSINYGLMSQTFQDSCADSNVENAHYLNGDVTYILEKNVKYPKEAFLNDIYGDVILSITIDKNGDMNNLKVVNSPSKILSTSSLKAVNCIKNKWSACEINGTPVDKDYLVIFRYRIYSNSQPPTYKKRAAKLIQKQKYLKALKLYNKAIEDNKYDHELFALRSNLNKIMNDNKAAESDLQQSNKLKSTIVAVVNSTMTSKIVTKQIARPK